MKSIFVSLLVLSLAPLASAQEQPAPAPAKKDCPLCKLPGRAALFAGGPAACPADCVKLCCKGIPVTYLIAGLVCDRCTDKITAALAKIGGVKVEAVSHETGQTVLKYDPAKVQPAQLTAAIVNCGYKVTGEQASFKVVGLIDDTSAAVVEKALVALQGVQQVTTVCHKSGRAIVNFDPAKTDRTQVAAAINTTRFKVTD
jgi:copper chaperone CopZ